MLFDGEVEERVSEGARAEPHPPHGAEGEEAGVEGRVEARTAWFQGVDLIDLGVGDADVAPPPAAVAALLTAATSTTAGAAA